MSFVGQLQVVVEAVVGFSVQGDMVLVMMGPMG
jgi:hypothetical protein